MNAWEIAFVSVLCTLGALVFIVIVGGQIADSIDRIRRKGVFSVTLKTGQVCYRHEIKSVKYLSGGMELSYEQPEATQ